MHLSDWHAAGHPAVVQCPLWVIWVKAAAGLLIEASTHALGAMGVVRLESVMNHVIDMSTVDRERFDVTPGRACGETVLLIKPKPSTMWDWRAGEECLRSVLVRESGEVVSAGFPKFFNYGERPDDDALMVEGVNAGQSLVTEKHDGTLIIRSVISGQVHMRTRGQVGLGSFHDAVMAAIAPSQAWLLDPDMHMHGSLLFEYCGPDNQIVLRYEDAGLEALALVDLSDLSLTPLLDKRTATDAAELIAAQRARRGVEGVVVWTFNIGTQRWLLTKVKSEEYVRLHALRTMMTESKVRAICANAGAETREDAMRAFAAIGIDWETFTQAHHHVDAYIERRAQNRADYGRIMQSARGDIARALQTQAKAIGRGDLFPAAIQAAVGNPARADEAMTAADLEMPARKAASLLAEMATLTAAPK